MSNNLLAALTIAFIVGIMMPIAGFFWISLIQHIATCTV